MTERDPESPARGEERSLAQAVVRGDRAALERFHALHFDPLYRFVSGRLGGRADDCEEVVQETFLAALESLHRFRGDSSLVTWLCGIARNQISRARRRHARLALAATLERVDPEIQKILSRLDSAELPDALLEREETREIVGATMASLPPAYQSVLLDKYVRALPVAEIARLSAQTPKAIESALTRARLAFKRIFQLIARNLGEGPTHV